MPPQYNPYDPMNHQALNPNPVSVVSPSGIAAPADPSKLAGPTGMGGDPQQVIQAILAKYPPGSAALEQAMPEIQAAFPGTTFDNSGGPRDEIIIPGYGGVDVLVNAETGGPMSWSWQHGDPGGGTGAPGTLGSMMGGGMDYGARQGALEDTPGYQFRLDQGMKALEGSAASKGLINTGGFAKDALGYAQGLASTEFDNEYRRLFGLTGLGMGAQQTMGQYGSSYGDNSTNLLTGQGDARAGGTIGGANAWTNFGNQAGQTATDMWMYNQMNKPPLGQQSSTMPGAVGQYYPAGTFNP